MLPYLPTALYPVVYHVKQELTLRNKVNPISYMSETDPYANDPTSTPAKKIDWAMSGADLLSHTRLNWKLKINTI